MGIYLKKQLDNTSAIGLWEITESADILLSQLKLDNKEQQIYNVFINNQRRLHWLSYRNLLKELISPIEYSHIIYDEYGKPHMADNTHFLSVAHSGKYSAVIISKTNHVGIDIELIQSKIEKIASRFLSETELEMISNQDRIEQLYVCWGAKEALYKLYGKKELDFRENILVKPFNYEQEGDVEAIIFKEEMNKKFCLRYEKVENYMLVYATGE